MSPGTESREKERFNTVLDVNQELLWESMQLQYTIQELKKELTAAIAGGEGAMEQAKKVKEQETLCSQDYAQYGRIRPLRDIQSLTHLSSRCMRRLQANLAYLAALADRKPSVTVPPCPAYLSPPPLNMTLRVRHHPVEGEGKVADPVADRELRFKELKELYAKLQSLYPNVDPKKEPTFQQPNPRQQQPGAGQQGMKTVPGTQGGPVMSQGQRTPQMPNMSAPTPTAS